MNSKKAERADVVAIVRARDVTCRFPHHDFAVPVFNCWTTVLDVHEIIPRSAWPDGELDPDNCILICRRAHIWIDQHPELAHEIGLHGYSWERT